MSNMKAYKYKKNDLLLFNFQEKHPIPYQIFYVSSYKINFN